MAETNTDSSIEISEGEEKKKIKRKVAMVDVSSAVKDQAVDRAEEKLTAAPAEMKGVMGFFKKIWKHNLFREYYRQKEISVARKGILKEGIDRDAMSAVMKRFQTDLNETVHKEAGEVKEILGATEREKYIKEEIEKSIRSFAAGKIDETCFVEEKNRIISSLPNLGKKEASSGLMYADNMLEVAKNIKTMVEHGEKLEELDLDLEVIVGKAKMGVRTEAQYNAIDKLTAKIIGTKLGSLVNETTVASAMAIGFSLGTKLSERFLRSNAAKLGSFGATAVASGAIAGMKEGYRFEEERKKHFRDMAKGKSFNPDTDKRRKNMEEYRYQTMSASDLMTELSDSEKGIKENYDDDTVFRLNKVIAETEARVRISDRQRIDLISFSSEKKVENERFELDIARAKAKVALKEALIKNLGFTDIEVDEYINRLAETRVRNLIDGDQGIEQKNKLFRKMKTKRIAQAVVKGTISGLLIGGVVQEAGAFLKNNQEGFVEGLLKGQDGSIRNFTALEFFRLKLGNKLPVMDHFFDHATIIGKNTISLTKGVELVKSGEGVYKLVRGKEILSDGIKTDVDGNFAPDTIRELRENGFIADQMRKFAPFKTFKDVEYRVPKFIDQIKRTVSDPTIKEVDMGAVDFVKSKLGLFTNVHRNIWFDNDTPGIFDKNELKCLWGGINGSGLDEKGNFVLNIKQMLPDGSYHQGFSIDAQKLMVDGKLKLLLSLSEDTQNNVIELPFDANGNAIINKDSEIAKLFFSQDNGQVKFLGRFAEVGQLAGKNQDGSENFNLLATAVGDGVDKVKTVITTPGTITDTTETVNVGSEIIKERIEETWYDNIYETQIAAPNNYEWDPPLFIPILGRTPLERENQSVDIPEYIYRSEGGPLIETINKHLEKNISNTLKTNPKAELRQHREIEIYMGKFEKGYRDHLEELTTQAGKMKETNRLSICIPVAGHQEGKNIYQSLENYTYQTADKGVFEIVLLVNAPIVDKQGKPINFDETPAEIERFRKDHPEMDIRVITTRLKPEEANIGFIRKLLTDATLIRQYRRGEKAKDLIMVSNDADNKGVSQYYVDNFIKKFDENPRVDGFLGQLDWDPESYVKYPAIHVGTRLFQYLSTIGRHRSGRMVSSGANFAFKSSIYAATGGYAKMQGGEDVAVGMAIVKARGDDTERIKFAGAGASRLYTSSRRSVDALRKGLAPVEQWDRGFSAFDDEVRKKIDTGKTDIDYDDVDILNSLKEDFELMINRTLDVYEKGERLGKGSGFYKRAVGWLGVEYELDDKGEMVITDMSDLVRGLKEYKEYGVDLRDQKSGKTTKGVDLTSFYEKDKTETPLSNGKFGVKSGSTDEKYNAKIGNYVVTDKDGLKLAKKLGSEELYVVKETEVENIELNSRLRGGLPEGCKTIEDVLIGKVDEEKIVLPEETVEIDGKIFRFYKAGEFDLETYLVKNKPTQKQSISLMIKVGDAIRELHKEGVVYLDLAPSNVLIDGNKVKLIDTDGAYLSQNENNVCSRQFVFGNRFIMAPELFEKGNFFNNTADVYAMGANLYRLTMGEWPYMFDKETKDLNHEERLVFYGQKHKEGNLTFPENIDERLKVIIKKAMDPRPSNRYQSVNEILKDLVEYYKTI